MNTRGSRAMIHRKGNLFYYALTEQMEDGCTIGIALVLNGTQTTRPLNLFALLRQVLDESLPSRGKIVRYDDTGNLHYNVGHLADASEECCWIGEYLGQRLGESAAFIPFGQPSVAYDGQDTKAEVQKNATDDRELLQLTERNNTVILLSDIGVARNYMAEIIAVQVDKIARLEQVCSEKENSLKRTIRQKNQYRTIIFLVSLLLVGAIVAAYLIYQKSNEIKLQGEQLTEQNAILQLKEQRIQRLNEHIIEQNSVLQQRNQQIQRLNERVAEQDAILQQKEQQIQRLLEQYRSLKHHFTTKRASNTKNPNQDVSKDTIYINIP